MIGKCKAIAIKFGNFIPYCYVPDRLLPLGNSHLFGIWSGYVWCFDDRFHCIYFFSFEQRFLFYFLMFLLFSVERKSVGFVKNFDFQFCGRFYAFHSVLNMMWQFLENLCLWICMSVSALNQDLLRRIGRNSIWSCVLI